jgi:hypothetical protein
MRKFKALLTALSLCILVSASIAHAADALVTPALVAPAPVTPALVAPAPVTPALVNPALAAPTLPVINNSIESLTRESDPQESARRSTQGNWKKKWAISLAPLVASEALDAASSYGLRELNPLLAQPDGRFGMKAAGLKFGVIGGLIGVEYLLVRKYPRSAKFFTVINWTTAGATTGLAIHNYTLPGR